MKTQSSEGGFICINVVMLSARGDDSRLGEASAKTLAAAGVELGVTYPERLCADPELARRRMLEGVFAVRSAEVLKAAEAAAAATTTTTTTTTEEEEEEEEETEASPARTDDDAGGRVDVLVDVRTGADYVVVPPVGNILGYKGSRVTCCGCLTQKGGLMRFSFFPCRNRERPLFV